MARRTKLLLCFIATVCFSGAILGAEQEVQDFEFADTDSEVKIVKRAAVQTDDEDFLSDEPGSAPDPDYEGSGSTSSEPTPPPRSSGTFVNGPVYYRVSLRINNMFYSNALDDRTSFEFERLSERISRIIQNLYRNAIGNTSVTVISFSRAGSVEVTFDLGYQGPLSQQELERVLRDAVAAGVLEDLEVTDEGLQFEALVGASCSTYVGPEPVPLLTRGNNQARLFVNQMFPCQGSVTGWEYYRTIATGTAYVGIWRPDESGQYVLVSKTALPPSSPFEDPTGVKSVSLNSHISVNAGDFIGVFYPRDATYNVIAQASLEDDFLPADQLYQTYIVNFYNDMAQEGQGYDLNRLVVSTTNSTFSLRAVMDYESLEVPIVDPSVVDYTCKSDEFSCGDGYCVRAEYRCDRQQDCRNGADEANCPDEPCLEGRIRCRDGTCINRGLVCNNYPDCPDGSDEEECSSCREDEFDCGNGDCISLRAVCNNALDCVDGRDERDCQPAVRTCGANEYRCSDGTCIEDYQVCDSRSDCPGGEDEFSCACREDQFRCNDGKCIPLISYCDAKPDCDDFSDEDVQNCGNRIPTVPPTCPENSFRCRSGSCIDNSRRCDNVEHCPDGSDEEGCVRCREDEFRCADGDCIDARRRCDSYPDCRDKSDEQDCITTCSPLEFECASGQCIENERVCDGIPDCIDRSDEQQCPICRRNEFKCLDGSCVDIRYRCDRTFQCPDYSDEFSCNCTGGEFSCNNGQCIPQQNYCDRRADCVDRSDEFNCRPTCRADQFQCGSDECIDRRSLCDGKRDCRDGSDEADCRRRCRDNQFQCASGHCLDIRRRCDGYPDCPNGSDETDCPTCSPSQFTCESGQCVSQEQRCDGRSDCNDGSDERRCPCGRDEFTCVSDGRCLPPGYKCNGNPDCVDGSDELECARPCTENEFRCGDLTCIPLSRRCDRRADCRDRSDEENCARECTAQEFRCNSGQCIAQRDRCDRKYDCIDGSDEQNCLTIYVNPPSVIVRAGTSASFECQVSGGDGEIQWVRRGGVTLPVQATFTRNRIMIPNPRPEDSGDYVCRIVTATGTFEATGSLDVQYIGPPTAPPGPDGPCGRDQATCRSGECIPRDYLCDGENDCSDGSDEQQCSVALPCEPNEFRCANNRCAMKIWRCDGDDDCFDGSDEVNCPARVPGAPCQADEFTCSTNNQCVPASYQCDGEIDCQDRTDEIGCSEPTITVPPVPEIEVEVNGTFRINCEAVGVPTPLIVWRLNWGNIPSGDRVSVTSQGGRGELEIRNARIEDGGAYTCEAINNKGSIFAVPDALIIVRRTVGVCQLPLFNAEATVSNECVRCFCFGHTQTCYSSNLQLSQISLGNRVALVKRPTNEEANPGFVQYIPVSREFEVSDFNSALRGGSYYWALPYQFLSKRLSSYGGELTYDVYYENTGFDRPTQDVDVILEGNGITLYHRSETGFNPRVRTSVAVPLVETRWERVSSDGRPISGSVSREDLMTVLDNVTTILIRATYDNSQTLIRLGNVLLTTGVPQTTGRGRAVYVEECTCPVGYTGYSCEECAEGFYKVNRGRYGRECIACNCNGYSNDCDPISGICRNCRDNTAGPFCNECRPGYVGDLRSGRPCQPCPCPLTNPENQFSSTCFLDLDGQISCTACPEGYEGRRCERCAPGFKGNPEVEGDRCRPLTDIDKCDPRGSTSSLTNVATGRCECKTNVEGGYCDTCKAGHFYLSDISPNGCISCFCMGVTQTCQSTSWNRAQIGLAFSRSPAGVYLTDMLMEERTEDGLTINQGTRELVYRSFNRLSRDVKYWSLPQQFLGDKLTAYGGNLRFTIQYRSGSDNTPVSLAEPIVEIGGNQLTLLYKQRNPIPEGRQFSFEVPLIESQWSQINGLPATREHFMMTLAALDFILIRATHTVDTEESAITGISMDIAEDRVTGRERAFAVEQCVCPVGFTGLSCQHCDRGYTKIGNGLYLGLCERCQCNGHSTECDPETGVCRNCRHNTAGDKCQFCARGYYGDATRGSVNDCQKCPCPLTESPNQFSPECSLSSRDNQVDCTACPIGHVGRRCERCADGYQGNPNRPGDYCRLINVTCDCDPRGTVPNTLCDPITQQCGCKNNVQGPRCSTCKEGYFNLDGDNMMGCLRCYCSGLSASCSSSGYYREEIIPMFNADGSHNFQVTNRRLNRELSDGFSINAERDEITFIFTEGLQYDPYSSLYFNLPPKFRGDKITSYGGYLRFGIFYDAAQDRGDVIRDTDVELVSGRRRLLLFHKPPPNPRETYDFDIRLTEDSFSFENGDRPTRESFMAILADLDAVLIRASYHDSMRYVTLQNLRMDVAGPSPNGNPRAFEVERCNCPEGYTGLSCQACALGYVRDRSGRCGRCNCNNHASSCDPQTGVCQNCQDNTDGDRCERCAPGYYGDPTAGTPNDCRPCPCPLTIPSNQFSRTCFLDEFRGVVCDRCPAGYTGQDCGQCADGYQGNPREPGGRCEREGLRVIINPSDITQVLGATVSFSCTPDGRGPFNVVWRRLDGRPLPRRATQGPGPNYLLTLSDIEYSDSALYVCTVSSSRGSGRAQARLTVERPDQRIRIRITEPYLVRRPGEIARLVCEAVEFSSAANYVLSWMKVGGRLPNKVTELDGVLIIPDLDESDLGNYTCTGSAPGSVDRAYARIEFERVARPRVEIKPSFRRVNEGASVEFQCEATGIPTPTVTWYKNENDPLPSYVYTDETGVFRIASASMEDQASYHCEAINAEGTDRVRTIIYVERSVQIIIRRANITGVIGESEQLVCYAEGGRDVQLVWTKDGGLPPGVTQRDGVLILNNIQPSYEGIYTCTGITSTGVRATANARVTVIGQRSTRPTAQIIPESLTVASGTTGTLTCQVTGVPTPTITWSRPRQPLSANHQVNGNVLRIQRASMEDRDFYICEASNIAGTAQAVAMVDIELREAPRIELYPSNNQNVGTGAQAFFQCRVIGGIPSPTVTWTRARNRPLTSRTSVDASMGLISFSEITTEEQGDYLCTAVNAMGTDTATATLIVEGPPSIEIQPDNTNVIVVVGERVNIECTGIGDPTPTVVWKSGQRRRSDVLPESSSVGPGVARLNFADIRKTDEGEYICVASNDKGTSSEPIYISVREGQVTPSVQIDGPEIMEFNIGQSVELRCSSRGLPNPRVTWSRANRQPLPTGHSVNRGVLFIPRVSAEDEGEYICTVSTDAVEEVFRSSIKIIVRITPNVQLPRSMEIIAGQPLVLQCQPQGRGPFNIEWTKVGGSLSSAARERNGELYIPQVSRADAGRYKCTVTDSSGTIDGYTDLRVRVQPTIQAASPQQLARMGEVVTLSCNAQGESQSSIRWSKDGGELPLQHSILDGILTLYGVRPQDSGRYICSVGNEFGSDRDFTLLDVVENPVDGGSVDPDVRLATAGERIELFCLITPPSSPVVWSKLEGPLPENALVEGSLLTIPEVRHDHSGTYVCTATNGIAQAESKIRLVIMSRPVISAAQRDYSTAAVGVPAQLTCETEGDPPARITWDKESGDLPYDHSINKDGSLVIPRVREEDAGNYRCLASNEVGNSQRHVYLNVNPLVPYFQQDPTSYMTLPVLDDVYLTLDILLSFRPEATDGLLLYNGQYADTGGDFVCFGMREQRPEFRFDVGAGPAVIRGSEPLELNKWHTVHLMRNKSEGTMVVNEEPAYSGLAPGQFQGLDLAQPLYLGGVPNYDILPKGVGFNGGFVGGLSQMQIQGRSVNLGSAATELQNVAQYQTCREGLCLNGGGCAPANNAYGFRCLCQPDFVGERCEQRGKRCSDNVCGPSGRCYNLANGSGYNCICPVGRFGDGCLETRTIVDPAFNKTSFISYPKISHGLLSVRLEIWFKPRSLDDGIILYNAQKQNGEQDFISITLKDQHIEFRFDTGSGPAVLRSRQPVLLDRWIKVKAHRTHSDGILIVDDQESVNEQVPPNDGLSYAHLDRGDVTRGTAGSGRTLGLNLGRNLHLGGVDPEEIINENVGVFQGFTGCIGRVLIGERDLNLVDEAIASTNVEDCGERDLCERQPCLNSGICINLSPTQFVCECPPQFSGQTCEIEVNICVLQQPCRNQGLCVVEGSSYRCHCALGWEGANCQRELQLGTMAKFSGNSYAQFPPSLLIHGARQEREVISMTISTTERKGLLFWQGQRPGQQDADKDYLALYMRDGHVMFSFYLGSGHGHLRSVEAIDDGFPHTIVVERLARDAILRVDTQPPVEGQSEGPLQVLNVPGGLFFGGVPDLARYTGGQHQDNFIGCISDLRIQDRDPLDFNTAAEGLNVKPCMQAK